MKKNSIIMINCLLILGCVSNYKNESKQSSVKDMGRTYQDSGQLVKSPSMQEVSQPVVIFYALSDEDVELLTEKFGEEDFRLMMDDINFYHSIIIDSSNHMNINVSSIGGIGLVFKYKNQIDTFKFKENDAFYSDVILFSGIEAPKVVNPIESDSIIEYIRSWK